MMKPTLLKGRRHDYYKNVVWGMKPYEKQQDVVNHLWGHRRNAIDDIYRFFVVVFGRQSGKSFLAKLVALRRAVEFGHKVMWIAPSSNNVNEHWDELHRLVTESKLPVRKITQKPREIRFYGGGNIQVRSALEGNKLRGGTMDLLILDEAAFFENGEDLWYGVIQPMVTSSRGQVMFTTTPNGRNWVYPLFQMGLDPDNLYYKSWHMPSMEAPYQDREMLKELKKTMPQMKWREEYEAEFLADSGGVFAGVDDASVVDMLRVPDPNATYIAGIDWGDVDDYTVFTVLDKIERKQVYGERFSSIGTKYQLEKIINLIDHWQPEKVYVERNGMGHTMFKMLIEELTGVKVLSDVIDRLNEHREDEHLADHSYRFGETSVIGVHVDNAIKRELVERTVADIEYGRLKLLKEPKDDPQHYASIQISEMSTYERQRTANGVQVTYKAGSDAHDDTISALILAMRGLPKPKKYKPDFLKRKKSEGLTNPFRNQRKIRRLRR